MAIAMHVICCTKCFHVGADNSPSLDYSRKMYTSTYVLITVHIFVAVRFIGIGVSLVEATGLTYFSVEC